MHTTAPLQYRKVDTAPAPATPGAAHPLHQLANDSAHARQLKAYTAVLHGGAGQHPVQRAPVNRTGLPDRLKNGIESLSGIALDHVRVHYNSPEPAQLQAHAYAQGSDIHLAPGQEAHLPHETWHVVQQAQNRVKPTRQMADVAINDDGALEQEADLMGAKAMHEQSGLRTQRPSYTSTTNVGVAQGKFFEGFKALEKERLTAIWDRLLQLAGNNPFPGLNDEFNQKADSNIDEGTFYHYVVTKSAGTDVEARALAILKAADGVSDGALRNAMRSVGALNVNALIVLPETSGLKDEELGPDNADMQAPPSPRAESRILRIPELVYHINTVFMDDQLLRHFDFILGGGAAMALKFVRAGRLGRPSTNMRDIDMDFQIKQGQVDALKGVLADIGVDSEEALMRQIQESMEGAIEKLPGGLHDALSTNDVRVSGRNTIMFNRGDLEYSFHFVNNEHLLGFYELPSNTPQSIKVINDSSHWELTKSALRARLKRPDKIQKTLIDACILMGAPGAGNHARRMQETAAIVFGGLRSIPTTRNTLRRLAGPAGPLKDGVPEFERQLIAGFPEAHAARWQNYLDSYTSLRYDRNEKERLSSYEIQEVRKDYIVLFRQILESIIDTANDDGRGDIVVNAQSLLSQFNERVSTMKNSNQFRRPRIRADEGTIDHEVMQRPAEQQHEHAVSFAQI